MKTSLASQLNGLKVVLDHDELIEEFQFGDEFISATIGVKDGPVSSPLIKYEIINDDLLIIRGLFDIIWKNIVFNESSLLVIRNGEPSVYKIGEKQATSMERKLP